MKKLFTLFTLALLAAFGLGGGNVALADGLNINQDLKENEGGFTNAKLMKGTNVNGIVANGGNGTATLSLDTDPNTEGVQAYSIKKDEVVTFSWVAYHGWVKSKEDSFTILNSEGQTIFGYSYDLNNCKITNILIGGKTAPLFESFSAQGYYSSKKKANGWNGNGQPYLNNDNNNTLITVKVHGIGYVEVNMKNVNQKFDKTYSAKLPEDFKIDLASLNIINVSKNEDRSLGINSLKIVSGQSDVKIIDYTVKRMVGESVINEYNASDIEGTEIKLPETPWYDANGKKYIYLNGDAGVLKNDNSVFTINYKEAATYNYSLVTDKGNVIIASSNYEGETLTIGYPRYILNKSDSVLVEAAATDQQYRKSLTLDTNNKEISVAYNKSSKSRIAFYTEGEDIAGVTTTTDNIISIRASKALVATTSKDVYVTSLPAGKYKIHVGCFADKSGRIIKLSLGDRELNFECTSVNLSEVSSEEIAISKTTQLVYLADGSSNNSALDYLYVEKTGHMDESKYGEWMESEGSDYDPENGRDPSEELPTGSIESPVRPENGLITFPEDNNKNEDAVGAVTGIDSVSSSAKVVAIFTANGKRVNALQKGLNILKLSDGSRIKVLK